MFRRTRWYSHILFFHVDQDRQPGPGNIWNKTLKDTKSVFGDVLMAIGCGLIWSLDVMAHPCRTSGKARPHLFWGLGVACSKVEVMFVKWGMVSSESQAHANAKHAHVQLWTRSKHPQWHLGLGRGSPHYTSSKCKQTHKQKTNKEIDLKTEMFFLKQVYMYSMICISWIGMNLRWDMAYDFMEYDWCDMITCQIQFSIW